MELNQSVAYKSNDKHLVKLKGTISRTGQGRWIEGTIPSNVGYTFVNLTEYRLECYNPTDHAWSLAWPLRPIKEREERKAVP